MIFTVEKLFQFHFLFSIYTLNQVFQMEYNLIF